MDIQKQIQNLLDNIECEHRVKIILAVESGSRAWGFPSINSDYDIRFIYHRDRDWYLSAFQKRDVIDAVFIGDLDAAGWDLSKCLQLLHKGNASLHEWLDSPVIYRSHQVKLDLLQDLSAKAFNPKRIFHHYLSLAKRKFLDDKTETNAKSFLYAIRALLCARWVADDGVVPPVDFSVLQRRYLDADTVGNQLAKLIADKQSLTEADKYDIPRELMLFARSQLTDLIDSEVCVAKISDTEIYDKVFREVLLV